MSRSGSPGEARMQARQRRLTRMERPPSWRSALNRAVLAAVVFLAVLVLLLGQPVAPAVSLAAFMLLVYIPLGYFVDLFMYRRRMRRRERERGG